MIKVFLSFLLSLNFLFSFGQMPVKQINPEKIPLKHKYKFIHNKYLEKINVLDDLYPDCYNKNDSVSYSFQEDSFLVKESIDRVWKKYKTISLKDTYCGNLVNLGFVYSKKSHKIFYLNDKYEGMKEGQIFFIRLNLLHGIKKLIVAYEITKIDEKNKMIQFCYINKGISEGSQKVYLYETSNGFTEIKHKTVYKSNSKFRDKRIYPVFHRKVVKELHNNLIKSLASY